MKEQSIEIPLKVGSRVTLLTDVDIEEEAEGSSGVILFEDYVEQYVPLTGLVEFKESDIGKARFEELLEEADGVEVLKE